MHSKQNLHPPVRFSFLGLYIRARYLYFMYAVGCADIVIKCSAQIYMSIKKQNPRIGDMGVKPLSVVPT